MSQAFGESWSAIIEIPFNAVFSTMSLFISFLVAFRLAEHYGEDRISCGILALVAFLILTPFIKVAESGGITVIPVEWIGSKGLFVAMIGSLLWTELFCWLKRKKLVIKMPDGVPPAVQESFAALIPALLVMILVLGIRIVFENTHYNTIHQFIYEVVATPVRHYGTSYFGALMTVFSITILWSVGINSGSMINGIIRPLWMENQTDNIAAIQAGTTPPHIITEQFFDMIWMGGAGATLSLVIAMLIFARSKNMREVARLGAGASVFNINEPILFGLPVIMNPIMLIPFNLVPLVLVTVQYAAMKIGAVAVTTGVFIPWTLPPVISGFIVTGHLSGSVMQLINLLIGAMLYLPFMRIALRSLRLRWLREKPVSAAVVDAVAAVEDFPFYKSVGYGGLPTENGEVELDAAYMDGDTLAFGAVGNLVDIANPVRVAQALSRQRYNSLLVGQGAREWALSQGFADKTMLTDRAMQHYRKRCRETLDKGLSPYDGHDTVGVIGLDKQGSMSVATSTSGLFMKKRGRLGDSPIIGSGFYCDSETGAATATGVGEDLMKGCTSYEIVRRHGAGYDAAAGGGFGGVRTGGQADVELWPRGRSLRGVHEQQGRIRGRHQHQNLLVCGGDGSPAPHRFSYRTPAGENALLRRRR
ncbi:hypothetical protein L1887_46527 [Cichorium endivia]|nr:hypothetical protein L1887_46527 [Cichorium endivia]